MIFLNCEHTLLYVKIAELVFKIDSFYDKFLDERLSGYKTSERNINSDIKIEMTDSIINPPSGKKLTQRQMENWHLQDNGNYVYTFFEPACEKIVIKIEYSKYAKDVRITLYDLNKIHGVDTTYFVSNALEKAFRFILLWNNGFTVHSSSVVYKKTGIAFSAQSGTGKSTHTGLWLKNYPGTYILNDDMPALRFNGSCWMIYGTPWAGTTGINENAGVPLKALVFLERSKTNVIRECSANEGIIRLFEAVIHPMSDEVTNIMLNLLNLLFMKGRICVLGCNMTDDAPRTVEKYLYGQ